MGNVHLCVLRVYDLLILGSEAEGLRFGVVMIMFFSLLDQFCKALEKQQKAAEEAEEAKRKAASGPPGV